jgi:hypothetical protein
LYIPYGSFGEHVKEIEGSLVTRPPVGGAGGREQANIKIQDPTPNPSLAHESPF